ncbi:DUF427 domain-containing protein [Deinococcus sp.]|uniref:DUF427 domain-containing protein n=1 Tax=Deinococcus sp. TaxID=47478 RepID=UPI0025C6F717|nr:DUF427 domain-containing protein [Deinococcus sp.]
MKATWNGQIIAQSEQTVVVEGHHYFALSSVRQEYLKPSSTHTVCPWKGTANYYTLEVGGQQNVDAAWFYPDPKEAAGQIRGHVAFWKGVQITGE